MQGQGGGAPTWSVAVCWVCRLWGFLGGAGQGQPPPVFFPGSPGVSYTAVCRWLLLVLGLYYFWLLVEPKCDPKLAAASARSA